MTPQAYQDFCNEFADIADNLLFAEEASEIEMIEIGPVDADELVRIEFDQLWIGR